MNDPLAKALSLLPHGAEFRFVDRLVSLEPGKKGVGEYEVRAGEPFLRGHFPGRPMFPGVLLVEAAAQLAGIVAQSDPALSPLPGLKLAGLRGIRITGSAGPGETIRLEASVSARLGAVVQATVAAWVKDQPVLRGELTLAGEPSRAPSK